MAPKPFVVSISSNVVRLRKVGQISLDPYAVFVYLMFHRTSLCNDGILLEPANGMGGRNIVIKTEGMLFLYP